MSSKRGNVQESQCIKALLGEPVEDIDELGETLRTLRFPLLDVTRQAPLNVVFHNRQTDSVERCLSGRQLLKDLDTEPRLLDHPANPSDLPFDPVQPRDEGLLLRGFQHKALIRRTC